MDTVIAAGIGIVVKELKLSHSATLTLTASPDVTPGTGNGYNFYRSTTSGIYTTGPLNGTTPVVGTSFVDTTIAVGVKYFYVATAVENGLESVHSNEATATVILPAAPSSLVVVVA